MICSGKLCNSHFVLIVGMPPKIYFPFPNLSASDYTSRGYKKGKGMVIFSLKFQKGTEKRKRTEKREGTKEGRNRKGKKQKREETEKGRNRKGKEQRREGTEKGKNRKGKKQKREGTEKG